MNFHKLVELIKSDSYASKLNEGKQPLIGIFWLYNNEIIGDIKDPTSSEETVSQIIDGHKIVNGRFTHWSIWNKLKPIEYKDKDCYFLPRGRVVSDDTDYKFIVFANKIMNTMEFRIKIKQYYNLIEPNIIWNFDDEHYN